MTTKLMGEKSQSLPAGSYRGGIVKVGVAENDPRYIDVSIREDVSGVVLRAGFPTTLTERTMTGLLLYRLNVAWKVGEEIDIEGALVGRAVAFAVADEQTPKGIFSRVVRESIVPG